ncbi:MAG: hypothetical protein ABI389_05375 [Rhodanobacter sp.]
MSRATDPQRMNWLWRLVCEVADIRPAEVVEALHVTHVPIDLGRARSWVAGDDEEGFLSLSIAELERNLRALVLLREDNPESRGVVVIEHGQLALESTMLDTDPGAAGMVNGLLRISEDGAEEAGEDADFAAPGEV